MKDLLKKLLRHKRGMVGLEAAIVLIAFVIIAAAFSFMVVNQGLFATERGKDVVQTGLQQVSTPLSMDGTIFVRTTSTGTNVSVIIIPLRAFGVNYVPMWKNETVVTLKVDQHAWGNVYRGVLYDSSDFSSTYDPSGKRFDEFVGVTYNSTYAKYHNGSYSLSGLSTVAVLAIGNSNGDESLNADEKGYLIVTLDTEYCAAVRANIVVEIRLEKTAPLSIQFNIPVSMAKDTWLTV